MEERQNAVSQMGTIDGRRTTGMQWWLRCPMADNFHFLDCDLTSEIMREFNRDGVAFTYAVDPAGTERYATLGELDLDEYVRIGGPFEQGGWTDSVMAPSHRSSASTDAPETTPVVAKPVPPPKAPSKVPPPVKVPPAKAPPPVLTSLSLIHI